VALVAAAVQAFVSSPRSAVSVLSKGTYSASSKSALFAQNGPGLNELLAQNEDWADAVKAADPNYFPELSIGQAPRYLWIGGSDSRVPVELITKSDPGHLFVHRNIGNQALSTDPSFQAVLQYAVDYLGVEDIIVCGHYECGGVKAAISDHMLGDDLENWLVHIRDILSVNKATLDMIDDADEWQRRAVEFNVEAQCLKLWAHPVLQNHARKNGKAPRIHGLAFDIKAGKLNKVGYDMLKLPYFSSAASVSAASVKSMAKMPGKISDHEARNLFYLWNDALATLDADTVAKRYAKKGVLLPTVSDTPRADYASIKDYFVNFLQLKPQGVILESYVTTGDNWCKDVGIYEFTMGATGDKVKARYSFVYVYEDGEWKIAHHHSSKMPEASAGLQISDDEVRGLFYLWNDALATLDPDQVAKRYAKEGVLLPTVSDTPRADYSSIRAYFVDFLKKKPQGEIMDSYVTSGPNWCKDVGTYEFTMGATGDKVKGRYSFVYVHEDGEWKIAHHHSSVMPEGMLAAAAKLEELEKESRFGPKKLVTSMLKK